MVWHRAAQSIFPEARQREGITFTVEEHHCALKYLYGTKSTARIEAGKCFCWWWRTVSYATYNKNKLVSIGSNWLYKSIGSSSAFLMLSGSVRLEKANSKALQTREALWPAVNGNAGTQAAVKETCSQTLNCIFHADTNSQPLLHAEGTKAQPHGWVSLQRNSRDNKGEMLCRK